MPSNFTQNYNLNQWEAGDRVLRTDFNADNAKIDAAIKAVDIKASGKADASALAALEQTRRSDLLGTYKFPVNGTQLNLSLTQFDLSKYMSLEVRLSKFVSSQSFNISFALNGVRERRYSLNQIADTYTEPIVVTSGERNQVHTGNGIVFVHLDGFALGGEYVRSEHYNYNQINIVRFLRHQWGLLSDLATPQNLSTINLTATNPVTSGGTVYLIGNRF